MLIDLDEMLIRLLLSFQKQQQMRQQQVRQQQMRQQQMRQQQVRQQTRTIMSLDIHMSLFGQCY